MTMMDYINEQPAVFSDILGESSSFTARFSEIMDKVHPSRIYIAASGTSRNAARAASPFIASMSGLDVEVFSPSSLPSSVRPDTLIIYISQGGASTNTISAIESHPDIPCVVLTGNPEGKIAGYSDNVLVIPCGPENVGPKTKGYTATILQLYLMFIEAASACGSIDEDRKKDILGAIARSGEMISENISRSLAWAERNREALESLSSVYITGKEQGAFVADEGALKVMETLLIPSFGFEFEEYLHGPICSLSGNVGGIYLLPAADDRDHSRFLSLIGHHRSLSDSVFTIGAEEEKDKRDLCLLMTGKPYTLPFEQIIPLQVISSYIPVEKGIDGEGSRRFAYVDSLVSMKYKP